MMSKAVAPLLAALCCVTPLLGQDGQPRRPLPQGPLALSSAGRLYVKFVDDVRLRVDEGGAVRSESESDVRLVTQVMALYSATLIPWIQLPAVDLRGLERRGEALSGVRQPDLAGMYEVDVDVSVRDELAEVLQTLPQVEFVTIQSGAVGLPEDIPPNTPCYLPRQGYLTSDPGMDVHFAWSHRGRGAGVKLSDVEGGWRFSHEDFMGASITPEPGVTIAMNYLSYGSAEDHGTSVLGITSGVRNDFGIHGIASDSVVETFPVWEQRPGQGPCCPYAGQGLPCDFFVRTPTAIANAAAGSQVGDVVLLELQRAQNIDPCPFVSGPFLGDPIEVNPMMFTLIKAATDAGVIVVEPAGNGAQNLDGNGPNNEYPAWRSLGDSGAILVGAGDTTICHNPMSFSSYGSRVDAQAWGDLVFSTGNGDVTPRLGDPDQEYTALFGGTSSASAMVAGACLAIQSHAIQASLPRLGPIAMRSLLSSTGRGQCSGNPIGSFVDLRAAITALGALPPISVVVRPGCSVSPGGTVSFMIQVINNSGPSTFDGWVRLLKPNGNPSNQDPYLGPQTATNFPPGSQVTRTVTIPIPVNAPLSGPYTVEVNVGTYASQAILHSSSFQFWIR